MTITKDVEEMLHRICFAPVPYETRAEMCAAVVTAVKEGLKNVVNGGH